MRMKYGEKSNVRKIRVKGGPSTEDERALIPLAWARQCIGSEIDIPENGPLYPGVDVARYGEDHRIILPGEGNMIHFWGAVPRYETGLRKQMAKQGGPLMTDLNKFGTQRLEYLKNQQPKIFKKLEDDGVLRIHLFYAQKRADCKMDQLMMTGMEEFEAEEIVLREIIQA
jgi:hypothetical protein